jgi:hypothetical protein
LIKYKSKEYLCFKIKDESITFLYEILLRDEDERGKDLHLKS